MVSTIYSTNSFYLLYDEKSSLSIVITETQKTQETQVNIAVLITTLSILYFLLLFMRLIAYRLSYFATLS